MWDICTYEQGYIDCKVTHIDSIKIVAERGSDPARYAYKDCTILYSEIDILPELLNQITMYPNDKIDERRRRFASQILAWKWYYSEGVKKQNNYLLFLAVQKIVLFSCRIVLNENRLLYPYHKWMLSEVNKAEHKPIDFNKRINKLLEKHNSETVDNFCLDVLNYIGFNEQSVDWPNYFLKDNELNWIEHEPPVDDI